MGAFLHQAYCQSGWALAKLSPQQLYPILNDECPEMPTSRRKFKDFGVRIWSFTTKCLYLRRHFRLIMKYGQESGSSNDGRKQSVCQPLDSQSARRRQAGSDRSRIAMFTTQCANQQDGTWKCYSRVEEEAESTRLINIAKANGLFIDIKDTEKFGSLYSKRTGESHVYANEELGLVFKVHNPYSKRVLKDLHPSDIIYEHVVHNILFPNARYSFVGISSESEEVRIVLSQDFCIAQEPPTEEEISDYLQEMGLMPENQYYFGNEYLSITDVSATSDNVLKDARGILYFIDPIIKFKKPAPVVIDWLLSDTCPMWSQKPIEQEPGSLLSRIAEWIGRKH